MLIPLDAYSPMCASDLLLKTHSNCFTWFHGMIVILTSHVSDENSLQSPGWNWSNKDRWAFTFSLQDSGSGTSINSKFDNMAVHLTRFRPFMCFSLDSPSEIALIYSQKKIAWIFLWATTMDLIISSSTNLSNTGIIFLDCKPLLLKP